MNLTVLKTPVQTSFLPLYTVYTYLRQQARCAPAVVRIHIACMRNAGGCDRFEMELAAPLEDLALRFCERVVKFMLWSSGGYAVHIAGSDELVARMRAAYAPDGARAFDRTMMETTYSQPFQIIAATADTIPEAQAQAQAAGGHLAGCRLGFDLGASDFKISAVMDGETVFAEEFPWAPVTATDPNYHFTLLQEGLKKAAAYLPRVDAIGGSSAGILVDQQIKIASLIRGIADADRPIAMNLFNRIQQAWNVPVEVANDGDVTALAGALSLHTTGILGIAMGSSEAVGYIDRAGHLTGRLSELAFAPVDFNEQAPQDEWSRDHGVGAMYFSQQAVNVLALHAGFEFPAEMGLPERLKQVQSRMAAGDEKASAVYATIGLYLGYTIPWYRLFYDFGTILLLGRVTSGKGGDVIVEKAKEALYACAPELSQAVTVMMPDEKARRVGQCVAAASLPRSTVG